MLTYLPTISLPDALPTTRGQHLDRAALCADGESRRESPPRGHSAASNSRHGQYRDRHSAENTKPRAEKRDRKSTRVNSSHQVLSYAVLCLKKNKHLR